MFLSMLEKSQFNILWQSNLQVWFQTSICLKKNFFFKRGPVNSLLNLLQYYLFYVIFFLFFQYYLLYILAFLVMRHPSSQIKDQTHTPCTGRWSINHWTIREVPKVGFNSYHSQKEIWIQKEEVLWLCLLNCDIYFSNPFNYTNISL